MTKDNLDNWVYGRTADNKARFVLGEKGKNPLICIGVNPSTAEPGNLDPTLRKVKKFAKLHGFDGWVMLNLYPQRATNPKNLHPEINGRWYRFNVVYARDILLENPKATIWAAWGTSIEERKYLLKCLEGIDVTASLGHRWITIGKRTNGGHPRHPLYLPYSAEVSDFDVKEYLLMLKEKG